MINRPTEGNPIMLPDLLALADAICATPDPKGALAATMPELHYIDAIALQILCTN